MEHNNHHSIVQADQGRRKFILNISKAVGSGIFLSAPLIGATASLQMTRKSWTVGEIMDLFIKEAIGSPLKNTVDTIKSGSRNTVVKGIATTMFATLEVIKKSIDAGVNFIIAHEPTFYNHRDETDWLKDNEVYRIKSALLKENNITVWRNHDYIHRHKPDGVLSGMLDQFGWQQFANAEPRQVFEIPEMKLGELIAYLQKKSGITNLRYIGDPDQPCRKVLLMPGAEGGHNQIVSANLFKPDVLIVGEVQEWETAEYIRDAISSGKKISLVVLGHTDSEEAGSAFMANWIKLNVAGIKVTHIPAGNPFRFS